MIALERILAAADRASGYLIRTPLIPIGEGGARLKLESLQPTGSFKVRGFFAAALALPEHQLRRGLLTVSAGNAAQACAYVARTLGVSCRVMMPDTAPAAKIEGVRRLGAEPLLRPREDMLRWMAERGWDSEPEAFIHAFADEEVAAGHGGAGLELLEQVPDLRVVLVPVGGGGLISGIAGALKALRPAVQVVGVQSDGYPLWKRALAADGPVSVTPATIADGTTAPYDAIMHKRLLECVDSWLEVPEPRLRRAVAELAARGKVVTEGAGALAYAALDQLPDQDGAVALVSGGNIDAARMAEILREESALS